MATDWQWENAAPGAAAGLATVSFSHPLDVIRTRIQVNDGRSLSLVSYKNMLSSPSLVPSYNIFKIIVSLSVTAACFKLSFLLQGFRGLYAGFYPAALGSTVSWVLYFYFYSKAKQRYLRRRDVLSPGLHLASAAEAGGLVSR